MARPDSLFELRAARGYPVVVLVSVVNRRILPALRFVSRLPFAQPRALHVSMNPDETREVARAWMSLGLTWLPLHIREAATEGVAEAVKAVLADEASEAESVTVVVPELNVPRWWHPLLHRRSARRIAADLAAAPRVTTVIVPFTTEFPRPLTDEAARSADVIITMGCGDACPVYPGKRYLDWDLTDPAGKSVEEVRPIVDDIERRVLGLLSELGVASAR